MAFFDRCARIPCFLLLLIAAPSLVLAQGGSCPSIWNSIDPNGNGVSIASYAGIKSCYYVSSSIGSDTSYDGTSETVNGSHGPFAHLPGMATCTANCAAVTPAAGMGFVLRGGDSWTSGNFQENWLWGGASASSQIYIGVDQGWYSGSSWARPIFNNSGGSSTVWWSDTSYWWLDNIEFTGMTNLENGIYMDGVGNMRASQLYFHGWTHAGNTNSSGFFADGGAGSMADHNVIDGSDSSKNTGNGFYQQWSDMQYNYISYVVSGLLGSNDITHDNVVGNTVTSADGDHCNGMFNFAPLSSNYILMYNNVVAMGTGCPNGVNTWMDGNGAASASTVGYFFGNIVYNTSGANLLDIGNHPTGNYGTYYVFNNTIDGTNGGCGVGLPDNPSESNAPYFSYYEQNDHLIACSYIGLDTTGWGGTNLGPCANAAGSSCNDVVQAEAVANAQGYSATENFPYQPSNSCTASSCATINAGANLTSTVCSGLSSINTDAYNACLQSTGVGVNYNSTTHVAFSPNLTHISRPATGAWDVGSYEGIHALAPVTTLKATATQ